MVVGVGERAGNCSEITASPTTNAVAHDTIALTNCLLCTNAFAECSTHCFLLTNAFDICSTYCFLEHPFAQLLFFSRFLHFLIFATNARAHCFLVDECFCRMLDLLLFARRIHGSIARSTVAVASRLCLNPISTVSMSQP